MKHIVFIDKLEKLNIKKDSTLQFCLTLKQLGANVFLLFEEDFFVSNCSYEQYRVYEFSGDFVPGQFYLNNFMTADQKFISLQRGDFFHMRLDPPFDTRYLKFLWMQKILEDEGVVVVNSPSGILTHNEKLFAFQQKEDSVKSYVGSSRDGFEQFCQQMKSEGNEELIIKPLDLYQGIGVEKVSLINQQEAINVFLKKVEEYNGAVVAQPFLAEVLNGEIRSIYFKGHEIGTILKVPKDGNFLANVAQGATYSGHSLNRAQKAACDRVAKHLERFNVPWIAYDIIGDSITEINVTCPGLLVEVSQALEENLAIKICEYLH